MILLDGHSLTPVRKVMAEEMSLTLNERESTASFTPTDMTGISVGSWLRDDREPGAGIVWRVKSIAQNYLQKTPKINMEHAVATLKDRIMFGKITAAQITGTLGATTCTARQAVTYILNQSPDWTLGTFDYDSVSNPYKFDGDTLYDALETVSDSLADSWWSYDFSTYPFKLNITEKSETVGTVLRAGRNLTAVTKSIDTSGMYTRFYPIGKDDLHIIGDYVSKNENLYGVIAKVEVDQSLETVTELTAWANERLAKHAEPTVTINVNALELADATGESLDALTLGTKCRIPMAEYNDTEIVETITQISYQDKIHQREVAQITLANTKTDITRIVADAIKKGGAGGRGSARQQKEDHAWFEDTNDHVAMVAEGIVGVDAQGNPNWVRLSQIIVGQNGIDAQVQSIQGYTDEHQDILEQAGMHLDEHGVLIYADDNVNMVGSKFEVQANKIGMVVGTNSGGNYIKAAEIATSINNAGQGVALISADHVNISSTSTAHLLSGSIKYDADGNLVLKESSGGGIVVERTSGQTTAQFGVFDNGNLTAGVIATKVNGESSTYIYGSNIVMSSTDSTRVNVKIDGKLTTTDLSAKIAEIQIVSMRSVAIDSTGYINSGGYIYAPEFVIGSNSSQGGSNKYVSNAITELQVVETSSGSGVYKIQKKDFGDSSWVDVTGNFSGAASVDFSSESLWSNGNKTLTLTNNKTHTVSIPTPSNYSGTYIGPVQDDPTMSVTVMVGGAAFNGQISASGAYNAGVTAGEGKFSPASPTLQGTQISGTVYHSVDSPNGVVYYTAGAKVKSTTLYADAGSEYLYKASAEATYYTNGTKAKKASGVTLTREYNWGTLYYWDNDRGDFLPIKTAYWYSSQYQLGATATAFEGSNVYVPDSNGSLYICAGSETLQKAINGAWYYKRPSSGTTCYVADNSGTTNLISGTSIRIAAVAAGYYGGSQVTNTYYTKTS